MHETLTIDEIRKLLFFISKGYKVPKIVYDTFFKIAKIEVEEKERVVLIKRDPNIGRGRIQAMYVKITEGNNIQFYPAQVSQYGADFDGDTVSVYVPLSKEAQKEAKDKLITTTSNQKINSQNYGISNEMVIGLYILSTRDNGGVYNYSDINIKSLSKDIFDKLKKQDPGTRISINFNRQKIDTTIGKVILNSILPPFYPFWHGPATKKTISNVLSEIIGYDKTAYARTLDKLMKIGFRYATLYPQSVDASMLVIPPHIEKLKDELKRAKTVDEQQKIINHMTSELLTYIQKNVPDLYNLVSSGATKDISQVRQIMVAKGLITDPSGNILPPIENSFTDGYTPTQYFNASAGARKGVIGRALGTADGGYEYRKIIYVVGNVKGDINNPNCETRNTLNIKLTQDIFNRMTGRFVLNKDNKVIPISSDMIGRVARVRSPIYCETWKICRTCYGKLLGQLRSENVGIISSQEVGSLSEKFMKAFHLGGIVSFDRVDIKKELLDDVDDVMKNVIEKSTEQIDNTLYSKNSNIQIILNSENYTGKYAIQEENDRYILPLGIFQLIIENKIIPVRIERIVDLYKNDSIVVSQENIITISYTNNQKMFTPKSKSLDYSKVTQRLDELISGKDPAKTVPLLYKAFYNTLSPTDNWDSVHLEVLMSNILRAKSNRQYPARMKKPFEFEMFSIKSLPSIISWPLGIAFENFGTAITYGMTSERGVESDIEKIVSGGVL